MIDKTNSKVSIIVPVYKVEKFIKKCVDSILNQTYQNLEIILINDGSPDDCGRICDEYESRDERVFVIHKDNGGLSDARNYGISRATGEYILFVDSDDFLQLDAIEKIIRVAEEYSLDIVCFNALQVLENPGDSKKKLIYGGSLENNIKTGKKYLVESIKMKKYYAAVWLRLYKTSLIKKNSLYFQKGLLHEDEEWTPRILLCANRVMYINETVYNYLIRKDSITQSTNKEDNILDIVSTCENLEKIYSNLEITNKEKNILKDYLSRLYINTSIYGKYNIKKYRTAIDKKFALKNSFFISSKLEAILFFLSIRTFRYLKLKYKYNKQ